LRFLAAALVVVFAVPVVFLVAAVFGVPDAFLVPVAAALLGFPDELAVVELAAVCPATGLTAMSMDKADASNRVSVPALDAEFAAEIGEFATLIFPL
jgi:hypothetical protein